MSDPTKTVNGRVPLGALLVLGMLGCTLPAQVTGGPTPTEGVMKSAGTQRLNSNAGKINGAVSASAEAMTIAGASDFSGATVTAYDTDGKNLAGPIALNADGTFAMTGLKQSRPRIFIEVNLNNIYFRAVTVAPRLSSGEYQVILDASSTYLADKLHRAMLDREVPFDRLDDLKIDETEETIAIYLSTPEEAQVQKDLLTRGTLGSADGQARLDLNAHAFDYFADRHYPVKLAVYQLANGLWRGWKPSPSPRTGLFPSQAPVTTAPTPTPSPTPTASLPPVK